MSEREGRAGAPTPPRWWRVTLYVIYGLAMVCAVSVVLGSLQLIGFFWPLMSVVWGGLILGSAWLVLSAVGLARYRRVAGTIIASILVFVPIAAVLWSGIVNDAQFSMSRTALGEVASSCTPATDVRAGLFPDRARRICR